MLNQLRLARARGSLTAPNSPVQDRALVMLDVLDRTSESKGRFEKVRQLVAAGAEYDRVKALYPEYFPDALEEIRDNEGDYDIDALDDSKVEWSAPDDEGEDEELSAWIENRTRGSISGADL